VVQRTLDASAAATLVIRVLHANPARHFNDCALASLAARLGGVG
jgi:hypothetical protein